MSTKSKTLCFLFLLFLTTLTNWVSAETIYVQPGEIIQDAINQAVSGDTVFLYPGRKDMSVKVNNHRHIIAEGQRLLQSVIPEAVYSHT